MKQNVLILLAAAFGSVHSLKTIDQEHTVPKRERRDNPEWNDNDMLYFDTYNAMDYTNEEFWVDRVWEEAGMVQITDQLYDKYIGNHKEGDTPWLISIGKTPYQEGKDTDVWANYNTNYSHMANWMKKAMVAKQMYGDAYHIGFIDEGTHEHLKESFPHSMRAEGEMMFRKLPYLVLIKDGRVYYRDPQSINQRGVHSFIERDYPEARIQSGVSGRIHPYMIYWEYICSEVRDMVWWRKLYTRAFNACSTHLEEPYRQQCRDYFKWRFGPLVPNKHQGRNAIILGAIIAFVGLIVLRLFMKFFYKHVLLMGGDEVEQETPAPAQKASKPNSGSRREKLD